MTLVNSVNAVKNGRRPIIDGGFNKAFGALPYSSARDARKKITEECSWARNTFDKKLRGETPFSNLEIKYIEDFFRQFNLNAWTGELLNTN